MGLRKNIKQLHRIRKKKERLPKWKNAWNNFNEKYFHWLEHWVEILIPWLVLCLVFVILGEYAHDINIFHWAWLDKIAEFFHHHEAKVHLFDQIIVGFFLVDLYFNFFKKRTVMQFVKTSILDIIAVAPLGMMFRVAEVGEAQLLVHVGGEAPKAEKLTRLARLKSAPRVTARFARIITRIPRLFRLHRLSDLWKKK